MDKAWTMDLQQIDTLDSPFHQQLLSTLAFLTEQLQQLVNDIDTPMGSSAKSDYFRSGVWEALNNHNTAMSGLETFLNSLNTQTSCLHHELDGLEKVKGELLAQRDELIERGHELHCRIGYNALERKLDETFTSIEKYTSEESAQCFKDEAEENLRRAHDLIRVANMRSCQLDRDMFKEMEGITIMIENYERDRDNYVKELDLFSDVRRKRITDWLSSQQSTCAQEVELAENVLDLLNLSQKKRHMEAQVIKNALRMYSFNSSLTFDREDNQKKMEELMALHNKVNSMTKTNIVLPRSAKATTDLTSEDISSLGDDAYSGLGLVMAEESQEKSGRSLHRCKKQCRLATDPVTEPGLLKELEAALRWEENDGLRGTCDAPDGGLDTPEGSETEATVALDSNSSLSEASLSTHLEENLKPQHPAMEGAVEDEKRFKPAHPTAEAGSRSTHSFLHHLESSTISTDRQITGLVRKKHNGRPVGSFTSVADTDRDTRTSHSSSQRLVGQEPQDVKSQCSEPVSRTASGGARSSREHFGGD